MSKFGWDLPPGVTTNMLPGNTPADVAAEAKADAIYTVLEKFFPAAQLDECVEEIGKLLDDAYAKGSADGHSDEAMAQDADRDLETGHKIYDIGQIIGFMQHQASLLAPENDLAGCLLKAADALREDVVDLDPVYYGGLNYEG